MTESPGDFAARVAANRLEAQRRMAVRRRRRQALPAVVASSATLAGLSLSVSWVAARMDAVAPKTVHSTGTAAANPQAAEARVAALARQLTAEEQALQSLTGRVGTAAAPTPAAPAARAPTPSRVAPRRAPATHATTGASGAG